jgi:photosystem II stability/assembly factor-like uncharacterized protein
VSASLAPSQASGSGKVSAVKGGITQAYQAVPYVKPAKPKDPPSVRYYLTGTATDEQNKLTQSPSATFTRTKPSGTTDLTQQTSPVAGVLTGGSQDEGSAFWSAPYKGALNGKVKVTWYWDTHDAAAVDGNLVAHLWADPGTPKEKELGSALTGVTVADGNVHAYTVTIDVKGAVAKELRLQGTPRYVDAGQDLTAHYGSSSAAAYFQVPKAVTPPPPLPTTLVVKDTNRLVLSATRLGRKAAEPTIGVTKQGLAFMTAADFDGVSPATPRTLIYASTDNNASWHNVSPMVAGQPIPPTTLDPYLYVDPDTGRLYNDDLTAACSFLLWSDDGGRTWSRGNPLACESPVDDHQTIVTGNRIAGLVPSGYPKIVYYCVNKVADAQCARSLDGGSTFTFTGNPAFTGYEQPTDSNGGASGLCGGLHGHIVTDPSGRLFLPKGHCDRPMIAISEDGGSTWAQVLVNRMLVADTQTSVASDSKGNLYYTWFGKDDLLPYMSVSRNHGRSWGPALLIAPPGVAAVNFPSIDAADPGHVVVSFPGSTARQATAARPWNYYVTVSTNALAGRPVFHSATANPVLDPVHRGTCQGRCAGMYDFLDVVIAPRTGAVWAAATDTCTSVACIGAQGPGLSTKQEAGDAQGVAVRMLSGPGLRH